MNKKTTIRTFFFRCLFNLITIMFRLTVSLSIYTNDSRAHLSTSGEWTGSSFVCSIVQKKHYVKSVQIKTHYHLLRLSVRHVKYWMFSRRIFCIRIVRNRWNRCIKTFFRNFVGQFVNLFQRLRTIRMRKISQTMCILFLLTYRFAMHYKIHRKFPEDWEVIFSTKVQSWTFLKIPNSYRSIRKKSSTSSRSLSITIKNPINIVQATTRFDCLTLR